MLNQVTIQGRLTKDPELRRTNSGKAVASFTLAVEDDYQADKSGDNKDVDFIDCVAWQGTGEFVAKYFQRGRMMLVTGKLKIRTYEKDGQKRKATEVVADNVYFSDSKPQGSNGNAGGQQHGAPAASSGGSGAPQNGGYGAPQNGGYGAPQNGGYGAPQNGGYGAPQNGGYGAPQNGGYGAPQNGGYGAPQNGGYGAPQNGGYAAPQNGQTAPMNNGQGGGFVPNNNGGFKPPF